MNTSKFDKKLLFILSPIIVIALSYLTVRLAGAFLGIWAWFPLALVLWGMFALMIFLSGGRENIRRRLGGATGSKGWSILALLIGLIPLPLFLRNWQLFTSPWLILAWVVFALINAPLEEGYWRGVLTDYTAKWPGWLSVLYSSFFLQSTIHLLMGFIRLVIVTRSQQSAHL